MNQTDADKINSQLAEATTYQKAAPDGSILETAAGEALPISVETPPPVVESPPADSGFDEFEIFDIGDAA